MPYKDLEKKRAAKEKWRKANLDKVREYQRKYIKGYRKRNGPPKSQAYSTKEWAMKKRELSGEDYKVWFKKQNDEKRRKKDRELYHKNKLVIDNYKLSNPCQCSESDITCLEFHHRDESTKKFSISEGKGNSTSMVQKEIAKCDILCKNCHMKLHNNDIQKIDFGALISEITLQLSGKLDKLVRRRLYRNRQKWISKIFVRDYKFEHNCKNCGEENTNCLIFHHRDPMEKEYNIPQLYKYGIKSIQREIDKCDLLCHNCHSKLHNTLSL